ncbi:MAG TPA: hypothetical protein VGN60_02190 [Devosia sp.]|nr:hypothetical protein [Devosia sp.]
MVETTGLTRDALHIHLGIVTAVLAIWVLGVSRGLLYAWLLVMAAALANEAWDYASSVRNGVAHDWADSVSDVFNTVLWPTVFVIVAKVRRWR